MGSGYIKIYRQMTEWEWYGDTNTTRLFLHCLLKANWKDERFRGELIPAGSFVTSYAQLAKETGLTVKQIRVALDHLTQTHEISRKRANKGQVITVEKWRNFQTEEIQEGKQRASKGQAKGKQTVNLPIYNQEDKEYKNIRNNNLSSIIDYLTDEQFTKIDETYDNLLELIDLIDDRLRLSNEVIKDPFAYMIAVARNENWPTKRSFKS